MQASHLALSLAIALWSSGAAVANDAPPSDESLREMFKLAHTEETMNGMKPQLDAIIASSTKQVSQGQEITPERRAIMDRMREKLAAAYNETFSFEPLHLRSYGPIRRLILKTKSTA